MTFRHLIPLAPPMVRPILSSLADWMDRTDRRLQELERLANQRNLH